MYRILITAIIVLFVLACEEEPDQPAPATRTPLKDYRTPTPVRASTGLGVSLADFKNEYGGLTFEYAQLNDGRDRWMASDVEIGVLVEVIGPERSLDQATMIVSMEIDSLSVTMLLATFLLTAAPDWDDGMDWVSDHIEESIGQKITTKDGDLTAEISVSSELGLLTLTIAGS